MAFSAVAILAVYLIRLDRVAGLIVDDAWYVLLARALAEGRGFRLVSSAFAEILPVVPPGYPALLALVFRLTPGFPANVLWLKALSVASMLLAGVVTSWYFARWRGLSPAIAMALAAAMMLAPGLVFLATSTVMAECVFMLGQMTAIALIEWSVETDGASDWRTSAAALVAAAATLVRFTGIGLLAAALLYLLYLRRRRQAVVFAALALACLVPWSVYARVHAPTAAERADHGGSIVYPYLESMRMRVAANPDSGRATPRDVVARLGNNAVTVAGKDMIGVIFPEALRGALESGQEVISIGSGSTIGSMGNAPVTMVISFLFSALVLAGWIAACRSGPTAAEFLMPLAFGMIVIVPYQTFRYTLALTPFLLFYLVSGVNWATGSTRASRIVILCVIGFAVFDHVQYGRARFDSTRGESIEWLADAQEVDEVVEWMRTHAVEPGPVAASNPALLYLLTGRKAIVLTDPPHRWREWKARGIRYLVCLLPIEPPSPSEVDYRLLYRTSRRKLWVIEI